MADSNLPTFKPETLKPSNQQPLPTFKPVSFMLTTTHLTKTYKTAGGAQLTVLDDVSFDLAQGDTFAIVGPSGSGKTTLLGLCAGLHNHMFDRFAEQKTVY